MMNDLQRLCQNACEAVVETGHFIHSQMLSFSADKIETKGNHDFVSYVDKTAELMLVEKLEKLLPGSGFLVEEKSVEQSNARFQWIIDPLDGTTNFIHAVPLYSISVALHTDNEPLIGIIYEANLKECFYTWKGGKAFLNGKPIHVSNSVDLNASLLATGFPYTDYGRLDEFMNLLRWTMQNTRGVRRLGSAAVDLAWVACGRFDGFFEYGLNPWDVAAGAFLVQQAGGRNSDFSRTDNYIFGKEIISCNTAIYDELSAVINQYLAIK
jgi:myo-inositol-1(or 4)-monophosphatase